MAVDWSGVEVSLDVAADLVKVNIQVAQRLPEVKP